MKKMLFVIAVFSVTFCFSQRNFYYNFTVNTTFTANENFGQYDEDLESRDWSPIAPNAILFRNGVDVDINYLVSFGFNLGLDWHPDLDVLALPYYIEAKFNLTKQDDDKWYIGGGLGKLLKLGDAFERGKYYKVGMGYHISTEKNYSFILNMDFHQKKIAHFKNGRLNSLSIGFGMLFL
ncbi:MAG: hypothetical protein JKY73_03560 [Lutibacter sp.]|nr:hypothetical protein [Lutibacter sp.]